MHRSLFAIIILALASVLPKDAVVDTYGEYSVYISITSLDYRLNIATADVLVTAVLPPGTGIIHIPLPFVLSSSGRLLVEPNFGKNLILFGDLRPIENYTLVQISLSDTQTTLNLKLTEVYLPLGDSTAARSEKALFLLFGDAYDKVDDSINSINPSHLTRLIINSDNVDYSDPMGHRSSVDTSYLIDFPTMQSSPDNVTLFLTEQRNPYLNLILPLVLGFPLGLLAGLQLIKSKIWAKRTLYVSGLVLVVLIIVTAIFFSVLRHYADTDLVLAYGTLTGTLIGVVISSIYIIRTQP